MSEKYPTLPNAPITEALVDIRCKLPKGFKVDQFKSIGSKITREYPIEKTMKFHETKIDVKDREQSVPTPDKINGYRYESSNGTKIVQLRDDGFTFNRLKPYKNWDEVREEALQLWSYYKELVQPVFISTRNYQFLLQSSYPCS